MKSVNDEMENTSNGTVCPCCPTKAELEERTLRELGVEGSLAADLELAIRMVGTARGDRVVGISYRSPDGKRYALRLETAEPSATSRAA
jgi:hypothetical protein